VKVHLSSQTKINEVINELKKIDPDGAYQVEIKKLSKSRTSKQNAALHKYFEMVADQLKENDLSVQQVLKEAVERDWDKYAVKSLLWKPVQKAIYGEEKTSKATTKYYDKVYFYLSHHLATKFGINIPFPSKENRR
jgi:hypothetical protein